MGNTNAVSTDVVVVGGGMVGSLTAAAFASCGIDVVLIEQSNPGQYDPAKHDLRVSAVSYATERMFVAVNAWQAVLDMRACPYRRMLVWDSESDAKTSFDSAGIGQEHLGYIVENRVLQLALWERLAALSNVTVICPATVKDLHVGTDRAVVTLQDGGKIEAALVVAADGAKSQVRQLAGIGVEGDFYEQHALVASVATTIGQRDITWQRFTPDGPQAFLPLSGNHASMVWYQSAEFIAELKAKSPQQFLDAMESSFPQQLGGLEELLDIGSFPLHWQHAERYVVPRVALVGDAAHSVHPLAGQGVNMGMLDAATLVESVARRYADGLDIGSLRSLRPYERWRRGSNTVLIKMLDGIHHAFQPQDNAPGELLKLLRGTALHSADKIRPLNSLCMKMAMGLAGDLPRLARGQLPL